jgi:hypothetical protein
MTIERFVALLLSKITLGEYEEVRELQPLQGIYNIATISFFSYLKEFTILPLSHFFHDY